MNDFTKEELKCIASWGDVYCFDNAMSARIHSELRNKIQSMIENYCEHKETYFDYDDVPIRCKKCLTILE